MNEKKYRERLQFQNQMISRQSKQIEKKNLEIEKLKQLLEEKDEIINAVEPMRKEFAENIEKHKQLKKQSQTKTACKTARLWQPRPFLPPNSSFEC